MMTKLRLGPIEEEKPVKLTVELPAPTLRKLGEYARLHARENGLENSLPPERLIAPMLERFMSTDRAFIRARNAARS